MDSEVSVREDRSIRALENKNKKVRADLNPGQIPGYLPDQTKNKK